MIFTGIALASAQTQADREAAKREVFVILDISGSMNEENKFQSVKEYIDEEVFTGLLKEGDSFTLITFGNSASEKFSRTLSSGADKTELRALMAGLKATDDFTDIGTAMETLASVLEGRKTEGVRQVILFITDGKNTPPRHSPYHGKDLALDEGFRSLGEKISKGGWFLYVIGIGAETDAKSIADSVPGSIYARTDEKLSDVTMRAYVEKVDTQAQTREAAEQKRAEEEKAAAFAAETEAERRRAEEKKESGLSVLLKKIEELTGIPASVLLNIGIGGLVVLLLVLGIIIFRALRVVDIVVSDNIAGQANTLSRKLGPMKGILLNSADGSLPGIGDTEKGVFRIERGILGLKVRILDEDAIAPKSPYKKGGVYKLKGAIIEMTNGNRIHVAVRKE
jgi:hypothetical protein